MKKKKFNTPPVKNRKGILSPVDAGRAVFLDQSFWMPRWLVLALIIAWIFWAGKNYFASHESSFYIALSGIFETQFTRIFNISFSLWCTYIGSLVWLLLFNFVAFHVGDFVLKRIGLIFKERLVEISMGIGLGLAMLSIFVFMLTVFRLLYGPLLIIFYVIFILISVVRHKKGYGTFLPNWNFSNWLKNWTLLEKLASLVLLTYLGTVSSVVLLPEIFYDSLVYHLALPYLWFLEHSFISLPFLAFSTMPTAIQINYCWGFSVSEVIPFLYGDVLAKLLHFSMGLVTVIAVYGFVLPRWGRLTGLLAAIFYYAIPVVTMNSWTSGNDVGTGMFQTLAVISLFYWHESAGKNELSSDQMHAHELKKLWFLSAIFCGVALSSKYTAIFGVAATFLVAGMLQMRYSKDLKTKIMPIFFYGLVMLLVWLPWLIKNVVFTGNPVHPFLYGYLGGQNVSDVLKWKGSTPKIFYGTEFNLFGITRLNFIWEFISSFWKIAMTGNDSVRYAGPILLLFGPVIFAIRKWPGTIKMSFVIFFLAYFFWFLGNDFARYLTPAYPCMALTLAFAWSAFSNSFPKEIKAVTVMIPLGISLAVWSPISLIVHYTYKPWDVLTGQISRTEFLSYSRGTYPNPSYKVYQYVNEHLPQEGTRILLVGDNKAYYLKRRFDYYTVEYNNPILETWVQESKDEKELFDKMKQEKITHIIINYRELIRLHQLEWKEKSKEILKNFWERHIREVSYFAEGTYLYELILEPSRNDVQPLNIMLELDQRGWKQQSLLQTFMDYKMWDNAIDEVESWARWGSPVYDLLSDLYLNRNKPGDVERAIQICRFAIQAAPQNVQLYKRLASLYLRRKEFNSALEVIRQGMNVNPADQELSGIFNALTQKK